MKVLNVCSILSQKAGGGTAERTIQMSRFLTKEGNECEIMTTDIGLSTQELSLLKGFKVTALPVFFKRFIIPKFKVKIIRRAVKNTEVVHFINHWSVLNALVYLFTRWYKIPFVVCPAGSLPIFGRSKLIKIIYNFIIGKQIVRNASVCIAITEAEVSHFISYGVSLEKIVVIPNGIECEPHELESPEKLYKKYIWFNKHYILFVGRLNLIKGPDLLVKAFSLLNNNYLNYHLVLAGPDEGLKSQLMNQAEKTGCLARIHFPGFLSGQEKHLAYSKADLLVIPSRSEAMSIVVLEAGAMGTPVLLTDQCGFNVLDELSCGKVTSATVEGLKSGLEELLSDRERLKKSGDNLKHYVQEKFNWNSIVKQYVNLFQKILTT